MKHTVAWTRQARDQVAEIWLDAADRDAVTQASADIDRLLAADPLNAGESRESGLRVIIAAPLLAYFVVRAKDRLVTVVSIWRF